MIEVVVDGKPAAVPDGSTALEALRSVGLDVPTACHDPRLKPTGGCRLCLVRLKGFARPVTACALRVEPGMEIEVETPELEASRRAAMEMLAQHYPKGLAEELPEKTFHKWLKAYGLEAGGATEDGLDASNPYFRFDPAACIKCFACVRVCSELQGSFVWQEMDRSSHTHVLPDSLTTLRESSCKSCGACSDACPTGALVDKTRLEMGQPDKWTRTTCPYCGVGCEMNVGTKNGRIVQALPVLDAPVSKGHLCVKGRYAHQFVHASDRAARPMIRRNGRLEVATWAEAIETVAKQFGRLMKELGPDSIGVLGSARSPNEDNYLAQKFARVVLGTNNVDCCARVCHGPTAVAMKTVLGTGAATNSFNDIEVAQGFLISGCNPPENHPIVGERIKQARFKGAKLIVIDPRRTELAEMADIHLALRPGTNVPLMNALAHVIFEEQLEDTAYLDARVSGLDEFQEMVLSWTPERAAEVCEVAPDTIRAAARLFASTKPMMCFHGLGMTEQLQGTEGVMCLVNLSLITGNIGKPGSGINPLRGQNNVQGSAHMGCEPSNLTGYVPIKANSERFAAVWGQMPPQRQGMNLMEMLDAARDGSLKAMWAIGYDIYLSTSDAAKTRLAFESMEFVVVQDLFLNETAREFADVYFPACSSFERDGTFMNAERRVQRIRKAIEPVGESKPDWEIIQLVAARMGRAKDFDFASAGEIWEEVRKLWLAGAGMSYERLEQGGLQWPCTEIDHPGTTVLHQKSFPIGDRACLQAIDYLPSPEITDDEYPFVLNTGRTLYQFNAGTMTGRTKNLELRPSDTLDINPDDAILFAIEDGGLVRVESRHGVITLPARVDRRVRRGELFATFHTPEFLVNLVTSDVRDRQCSTPAYKVTAVRLTPVMAGKEHALAGRAGNL